MDIEKIQSSLRMKNFYFSESSILRTSKISNGKYTVDVKKVIQPNENHSYNVTVVLTIKKGDELNLKVSANADFEFVTGGNGDEENMIENNTVAIMFPFIRTQVSLLTAQPAMNPIVLPPIDTSKLVNGE